MINLVKGIFLSICFSTLAVAGGGETPSARAQRIAIEEAVALEGLVALKLSRPNSVTPSEVTPQPMSASTCLQPRMHTVNKFVPLAQPRVVTDAELQKILDDSARSEQERIFKTKMDINQNIQKSLDTDDTLYAIHKSQLTGLSERERKNSQAQLILKLQRGKRYRDYQRSLWPRPTKPTKKVSFDALRQLMCLDEEMVTVEEPVS